jgi:hypothetical protein
LQIVLEVNPLATDYSGNFLSSWGWFCSFQPPPGVFTQQNNENTHTNIRFFVLRRPYYRGVNLNSCPAFVYVCLDPVASCARVLVHEVLDRNAQAAVRGGARCAPLVLGRGARPMTAAPRIQSTTPFLRAISAALWSTINLIAVRLSRCVRGVAALAAAASLTAAIFEGAACGTENF